MRQSLSEPRTTTTLVLLAIALTLALGVAGLTDQLGGRSLMDHASELYAPHGKDAEPGVMYGVLYTVAVLDLALWLLVLRSARAGGRWTLLLTAIVTVVGASLAALLLGSKEYGEQIFPTVWGLLALLPPAAGVVLIAQLLRRRSS